MEIEMLSTGEMVNMYEVHVRDMAEWSDPEKVEELRDAVSEKLGISGESVEVVEGQEAFDRLMPVEQNAEVCAVTRDL